LTKIVIYIITYNFLFLSLGSIAAIAAPVAAVVACGSNKNQGNDEAKELAATNVNFFDKGQFAQDKIWSKLGSEYIQGINAAENNWTVYTAEFKFDSGVQKLLGVDNQNTAISGDASNKLDKVETALVNYLHDQNLYNGQGVTLGSFTDNSLTGENRPNDTIIKLQINGLADRNAINAILLEFNYEVNKSGSSIFTGDAAALKEIWNKMYHLLQLKDLEFQVGQLQKITAGLEQDAQDASSAFEKIHALVDSSKLNTDVTKTEIVNALNSINGISGVTESDITNLDTSIPGVLKIRVDHPGINVHTITLDGFKIS